MESSDLAQDDRPIALIDFDGVINQFPDEKVRCRQNSTTLHEIHPLISTYKENIIKDTGASNEPPQVSHIRTEKQP